MIVKGLRGRKVKSFLNLMKILMCLLTMTLMRVLGQQEDEVGEELLEEPRALE